MMLRETLFSSIHSGENQFSWNDLSDAPMVEYELGAHLAPPSSVLYSLNHSSTESIGPSRSSFVFDGSDLSDFDDVVIVYESEEGEDEEEEDDAEVIEFSSDVSVMFVPPSLPSDFRKYGSSWEDDLFGVALAMPEPSILSSLASSSSSSLLSDACSPAVAPSSSYLSGVSHAASPASSSASSSRRGPSKKATSSRRGRKRKGGEEAAEVALPTTLSAPGAGTAPSKRRRRATGKQQKDTAAAAASEASSSSTTHTTNNNNTNNNNNNTNKQAKIHSYLRKQQEEEKESADTDAEHEVAQDANEILRQLQQHNSLSAEHRQRLQAQLIAQNPHFASIVSNLEQYYHKHASSIVVVDPTSKDASALLNSLPAEPMSLARPLPEVRDGKIGLVSTATHSVNESVIRTMFQSEEVVSLTRANDDDEDEEVDIL